MCHHAKFRQNRSVYEISQFFDFQDGCRPPSWILKFFNFWFFIRWRGLKCIIVSNFIKIGGTAAEILRLTFDKMAAVCHLRFLIDFLNIP